MYSHGEDSIAFVRSLKEPHGRGVGLGSGLRTEFTATWESYLLKFSY